MQLFIGIDVSKDDFHVASSPSSFRATFANDPEGIRDLVRSLRLIKPQLIVLEPTGSYHVALRNALHAADLPVRVVNARHTRCFIQADGELAKNDDIDAAGLALYAERMRPIVREVPDERQQQLRELMSRRLDLVEMMSAEKNRRECASPWILRKLNKHIRELQADIDAVEAKMTALLQADSQRWLRYQLLLTVPGVGKVCGFILLAMLPELGRINRKEVAALVGVAPFNFDSAAMRVNALLLLGGRSEVRRVLYGSRLGAQAQPDYQRLLRATDRKWQATQSGTGCVHAQAAHYTQRHAPQPDTLATRDCSQLWLAPMLTVALWPALRCAK